MNSRLLSQMKHFSAVFTMSTSSDTAFLQIYLTENALYEIRKELLRYRFLTATRLGKQPIRTNKPLILEGYSPFLTKMRLFD